MKREYVQTAMDVFGTNITPPQAQPPFTKQYYIEVVRKSLPQTTRERYKCPYFSSLDGECENHCILPHIGEKSVRLSESEVEEICRHFDTTQESKCTYKGNLK